MDSASRSCDKTADENGCKVIYGIMNSLVLWWYSIDKSKEQIERRRKKKVHICALEKANDICDEEERKV